MNSIDEVIMKLQSYRLVLSRNSYSTEKSLYDTFPLYQVLEQYQRVGKHFVDEKILHELDAIKSLLDTLPGEEFTTRILRLFLAMSLDKYGAYYNYTTYIGADLLDIPFDNSSMSFDEYMQARITQLILFLCDVALFECRTLLQREERLAEHLTPLPNRKRRLFNLLRGMQVYEDLAGGLDLPAEFHSAVASYPPDEAATDMPYLLSLTCLLERISGQVPVYLRTICDLTMEPVWIVHDEYMFIRILQCFEMIFSIIVKGFFVCQERMQEQKFTYCAAIMNRLTVLCQRNPALFRILTSMPRETFSLFRVYTDGASAIQSKQYKLIEALAARPSPARLQSVAFASVPEVKRQCEQGELLHFEDLLQSRATWGHTAFSDFLQSMVQFDQYFVQWKKAHANIAVKMLGAQPGTGYTVGTPYLRAHADVRLFPFLPPWESRDHEQS